jgi:prepilin-type N-terminal cleavage/methylation domain-containing protein
MKVPRKGRSGFTLPEVLVTVSIIAIISAVVVPSVVRQIDKGDTGRLASDVSSIRTGVEQFVSDVRKYPGDIGQLTHGIAGATDKDLIGGVVYTANQQARWKGPYVSKDSLGMMRTAYGWNFNGAFAVDTFTASPFVKALALTTDSTLDKAQVFQLDTLLDDGNGGTGTIRFSGATVGRMKVILVPIQ